MSSLNGKDFEYSNGDYYVFYNGFSILSNVHLTPFTLGHVRYRSVEQYLAGQKALLFKDYIAHQAIMEEKSARKLKDIPITGYNFSIWRKYSTEHLLTGLRAKFQQHVHANEKLLGTGQQTIVYASALDRILGSGHAGDDPKNLSRETWEGLNELGAYLMQVRDELQQQQGNSF